MKRRKPRASEVRVDFGQDQILSGMQVSDDGTLTFFGEHGEQVQPESIDVGACYQRPSKVPKSLFRSIGQPNQIQLDPNHALERFDFVFAVDTNTQPIGSVAVSVAVPILIRGIEIGNERWNASLVQQAALEFHDAGAPPERIGWMDAIQRITTHPSIKGTIALIVDSELDHLGALNSRSEPVLGQDLLPEGRELVYGSAERATEEYIGNAAIAECDRIATRILRRLVDKGFVGEYSHQEHFYTRARYWKPPTSGKY